MRDGTTHIDIAGTLTDRAIEMFFAGDGLLFVITMAHPGHMLFTDSTQSEFGEGSPTTKIFARMKDRGVFLPSGKPLDKFGELLNVLRRDANSLKHASQEPNLEWHSVITTLATSCTDAQALDVLSWPQRVFMWWWHATQEEDPTDPWPDADAAFPNLRAMEKDSQLARGLEVLRRGPLDA